jgi:hypothetical protein
MSLLHGEPAAFYGDMGGMPGWRRDGRGVAAGLRIIVC